MLDSGRRPSWAGTGVLLAAFTVLAFALRFPSLGDSIWGDELSTNYVVHGFGLGNVVDIVSTAQEGSPPLFFLLTWLTKGIGGVEGMRIVSLAAGLASVPLIYMVGARTVGRPAGMAAAALMTLSPFQIFYATEARTYALLVLLTLLATLLLLIAVEDGRTRWWYAAYAAAVAAVLYTQHTGVFVLFTLFAWALIAHPGARRPVILANLAAAVVFIPWLPEFRDDSDSLAGHVLEVAHPLSLDVAVSDLIRWSVGHPFAPAHEVPGHPAFWAIVLGAVLGAVALALRLRGERRAEWWPPRPELVLVVALGLVTPLALILHNVVAPTIFIPRNLSASWPGMALLLGAVITAGRAPLRYAAIALVMGGFAVGAVEMTDADHRRPDFLGIVDFVRSDGQPRAPLIDDAPYGPGPQTPLEAAAAAEGEAVPRDPPVLQIGTSQLPLRLELARAKGGIFEFLFPESPEAVARRAARLAGGGRLYLAAYGSQTEEELASTPGAAAGFIAALPPRFHAVESRRFPGFSGYDMTVHVFEGDGSIGSAPPTTGP